MATTIAKKTDYGLSDYKSLEQWVAERPDGPLNNDDKLWWFIRQHVDELIEAGEYLPGVGARPSLIGPGFDRLAAQILQRKANAKRLSAKA